MNIEHIHSNQPYMGNARVFQNIYSAKTRNVYWDFQNIGVCPVGVVRATAVYTIIQSLSIVILDSGKGYYYAHNHNKLLHDLIGVCVNFNFNFKSINFEFSFREIIIIVVIVTIIRLLDECANVCTWNWNKHT